MSFQCCNSAEKRTVLLFPEVKLDMDFHPFNIYHIEAKLTEYAGSQYFKCVHITPICSVNAEYNSHLSTLPLLTPSLRPWLVRFKNIIQDIKVQALKQFAIDVLRDDITLIKFLMVPASRRHHHAHRCGLFMHSVEVAEALSQTTGITETERETSVIAGLYHDIGKTMTMTIQGAHTGLGTLINHDSLTLEVCSAALKKLDTTAPSVSNQLRHIWCKNHQYSFKHTALTSQVSRADRLSLSKQETTVSSLTGAPGIASVSDGFIK